MKAIIPPLNEQEAEIAAYSRLFKIDEPLYITRIDWNHESRKVGVYVDFRRGGKFVCSKCGRDGCAVDKTADKSGCKLLKRKTRHSRSFTFDNQEHYRERLSIVYVLN
jgi:hypothetical protein